MGTFLSLSWHDCTFSEFHLEHLRIYEAQKSKNEEISLDFFIDNRSTTDNLKEDLQIYNLQACTCIEYHYNRIVFLLLYTNIKNISITTLFNFLSWFRSKCLCHFFFNLSPRMDINIWIVLITNRDFLTINFSYNNIDITIIRNANLFA